MFFVTYGSDYHGNDSILCLLQKFSLTNAEICYYFVCTTLAGFLSIHDSQMGKFLCFDFQHTLTAESNKRVNGDAYAHVTLHTILIYTQKMFLFIILFVLFLFFLTRCIAANVNTLKVAIISIKLIIIMSEI